MRTGNALAILCFTVVMNRCLAWSISNIGSITRRNAMMASCSVRQPKKSALRMEFLGFNLGELASFGNMIVKCEASHILIRGPEGFEKCNELKQLVKKRIDIPAGIGLHDSFAQLAEEYSECPSARNGGSLGSFKPGQMVAEFDEVCFKYPIGQVHGPIQTRFGTHLILITSRTGDAEAKKSGCG